VVHHSGQLEKLDHFPPEPWTSSHRNRGPLPTGISGPIAPESAPDYRILVVFDVWYWETERCGYPPVFPPAPEASGFIDFAARQILIRCLAGHTGGLTMAESLIHEMAHAATDGEHDADWQAEMTRLKGLGAPVSDADF
jgi:hypothetical protein